jgi:nitrogen fixation protein NifX
MQQALPFEEAGLTKVAFATADGQLVNEHFGSARKFVVHALSATSDSVLSTKEFAEEAQDGNEDKLKVKLAWLEGCDVVVCAQVGQSAAKQLLRHGIQPIAVDGDPAIAAVVDKLQSELSNGAAWTRRLKKAAQPADNFAELVAGDWNE